MPDSLVRMQSGALSPRQPRRTSGPNSARSGARSSSISTGPWRRARTWLPPISTVRRVLASRRKQIDAAERALWSTVSLFTPWSDWAAGGLRAKGVSDERIMVLPPGVDLDLFKPPATGRLVTEGPLRLLFVGGDFERKGGPLLLDALRGPIAGRCELDVVTRDDVCEEPGVSRPSSRGELTAPSSALR